MQVSLKVPHPADEDEGVAEAILAALVYVQQSYHGGGALSSIFAGGPWSQAVRLREEGVTIEKSGADLGVGDIKTRRVPSE